MGRYTPINTRSTPTGKAYKSTVTFPKIPSSFNDLYAYTDEGDRFDLLAQSYYGDPTLWWIISLANPQFNQGSMYPPLGVQIRIPTNISAIITQYEAINSI